jgi:hypothetical protein
MNLLTWNDFDAGGPVGLGSGATAAGTVGGAGGGTYGPSPGAYGPFPWKAEPPVTPAAVASAGGSGGGSSSNGTPWPGDGGGESGRKKAAEFAAKPLMVVKDDTGALELAVPAAGGRAAAPKVTPPKPIAGELAEGAEEETPAKGKDIRITALTAPGTEEGAAAAPGALTLPGKGPKGRAATKAAYKQPSGPVAKVLKPTTPTPGTLAIALSAPVAVPSPVSAPVTKGSDLSRFRKSGR